MAGTDSLATAVTGRRSESRDLSPLLERRLPALQVVLAAILLLAVGVRLVASWRNFGDLDTRAGVWTTLAVDLAKDGTLYRPLVSGIGYGGTRYAPLQPILHAALIRIGVEPFVGGFSVSFVAVTAVLAGVYAMLRRCEVPTADSFAIAALLLATKCFEEGIAEIHGDPLAIALDLGGLLAVIAWRGRETNRLLPIVAAVCFALSVAAKLTSIFGLVASIAWLIVLGKRRQAVVLGVCSAAMIAICVVATQFCSGGRAIHIFAASAGAGGGLANLVHAPLQFISCGVRWDRPVLAFWGLGIVLLIVDGLWATLPGILFIVTTAGTILIFGSPGTATNHFMSLQVASVILIGFSLRQAGSGRVMVRLALVLLAALGIRNSVSDVRYIRGDHNLAVLRGIVAEIDHAGGSGAIYANDPMIPVLAGERPYLLDGFIARAIRQKNPGSAAKLWDDLDQARFRACVIDAHTTDFGVAVAADDRAVMAHMGRYTLAFSDDVYRVYLRKPG